ncbi:MAG: hypothetical protein QNJ02_15515 [Desulfobacterales bacterium]|nr:hypothetical protein [Desulfobacterales bacterium]MDJ0876681.1 hypothetical protein [Desulfobacterales bacterium]
MNWNELGMAALAAGSFQSGEMYRRTGRLAIEKSPMVSSFGVKVLLARIQKY